MGPFLHILILLSTTVSLTLLNSFARGQEPDPIVSKARDMLYHNCHVGIALLESAVQRSPHNIACWDEYVYELDFSTRFYFAERASRESLRLNPNDPVLLVARARILQPAPALDVLTLLEKQPGHSEEARRLRELVQLGLGVPRDWNDLSLYVNWAKANICLKRWDRALAAVDEGLRKSNMPPKYYGDPDPGLVRELLASKAMVLVNTGKFDQGMELQKACHYLQLEIDGGYDGVGDNLLDLNRPDLVVQSFGGKTPKKRDDRMKDEQRMVLACAHAETKNIDRAERLLRGRDNETQLLLLWAQLAAGKNERAKQTGARIVARLPNDSVYGGPWFPSCFAVSLDRRCVKTVAWLNEHYPAKKDAIRREFGDHLCGDHVPEQPAAECLPTSQLIPLLRERLNRKAPLKDELKARRELAQACSDAERYADAAEAIQCEALWSPLPEENWSRGASQDAVNWCVWKRRADTEALHQKDPRLIASARQLLDDLKAYQKNDGTIDRTRFNEKEAIERLVAIGPGVLSAVIDDFEPNVISGLDRSSYVAIIRRVGGIQDIPVLLDVLYLVSLDSHARESLAYPGGDLATETAILSCLEKLTGTTNPETSRAARVEFWARWWRKNEKIIVTGNLRLM